MKTTLAKENTQEAQHLGPPITSRSNLEEHDNLK